MSRLAWWVMGLILTATVHAEVGVQVSFERSDFLLFEKLEARVKITNQNSEPLDMGRMSGDKPWLEFYVTTTEDEEIERSEKAWTPPPLHLMPGEVKSLTFNLLPWFLIRETGQYRVVAEVVNRGKAFSSNPVKFSVVNGPSIWQQEYTAAADPKDASKTMRPRLYSLHVHRVKQAPVLYLRIQNPEAHRVYCTAPLGDIVNYGDPKARVDRKGNVHVLHQSGTRLFTYSEYSPAGKSIQTRYFSNISSTPAMVATSDDETMIVGGEELFENKGDVNQVVPTAPVARPPEPETK